MIFTSGSRSIARWVIIPFFITACLVCTSLGTARLVRAGRGVTSSARTIKLGSARAGSLYAITLGVRDPAQVLQNESILVTLSDAKGVVGSKWLHSADLDFYLTLRPRVAGPITVKSFIRVRGARSGDQRNLEQDSPGLRRDERATVCKRGVIAAAPNDTWQERTAFRNWPDHLRQRR